MSPGTRNPTVLHDFSMPLLLSHGTSIRYTKAFMLQVLRDVDLHEAYDRQLDHALAAIL